MVDIDLLCTRGERGDSFDTHKIKKGRHRLSFKKVQNCKHRFSLHKRQKINSGPVYTSVETLDIAQSYTGLNKVIIRPFQLYFLKFSILYSYNRNSLFLLLQILQVRKQNRRWKLCLRAEFRNYSRSSHPVHMFCRSRTHNLIFLTYRPEAKYKHSIHQQLP